MDDFDDSGICQSKGDFDGWVVTFVRSFECFDFIGDASDVGLEEALAYIAWEYDSWSVGYSKREILFGFEG
jgi:hypothetical protein